MGAGAFLLGPMVKQWRAFAAERPAGQFLAFCTPNGHVRSEFGATGAEGSFALKRSLTPLAPFKNRLSVLTLDNPAGNDSHESLNRVLTCARDKRTTGQSAKYTAGGPSVDWSIANRKGSRPINASTLVSYSDWHAQLSWKAAGVPAGNVGSASSVYSEVFASTVISPSAGPPSSAAVADRLIAQRRSVLDFVMQDIASLRPRLAVGERSKLDSHLDSLRQMEKGLAAGPDRLSTATVAVCARAEAKAAVDATIAGGEAERLRRSLDVTSDVIATAFACGLRNSATLLAQPASKGINPFIAAADKDSNHHGVSHGGGGGRSMWAQIDTWYAERFAYLLRRLTDLNIADRTIVAWVSEISEPHNQDGSVIPVFGGDALGMQLGRTMPAAGTFANLWTTVHAALGVPVDSFGTDGGGNPAGPTGTGTIASLWRAP